MDLQLMLGLNNGMLLKPLWTTGMYLESSRQWAQNMITAFARMNGQVIGIIANQPMHLAGALDVDASDKASRFIRFCDAFNIPLMTLVDIPGYLPGTHQEYRGIIRHGSKMLYAYSESTVPKVALVLRKDYGGGISAMCPKEMGMDQNVRAADGGDCHSRGGASSGNSISQRDRLSQKNRENYGKRKQSYWKKD
jgi:acetyl-CoA carboxylase carboxyltransferase component